MGLRELYTSDDLGIQLNPEAYQDQTNPPPPLPGNYRFQVVGALAARKDANGELKLTDGQFPTLTINRVKIVEPSENEKEFGIFHDIRTKPFDRYGTVASDVADFTRSVDQTRGWSGLGEGLEVLDEMVQANATFTAQIKWEAYDAEYVEKAFAELGIAKGSEKAALASGQITDAAYKAIYKKARLVTNDFLPDGKGGRKPSAKGPSGNSLEAKAKIGKFFPSLESVTLGAFKVK